MERTGQISINGTVNGIDIERLAAAMKIFLDEHHYSQERYTMLLYDDGDNLNIELNDPDSFEIHFLGNDRGYLLNISNGNYDTGTLPILKDLVAFFDAKNIHYNIEVQHEYANGEWRDEDFFVHPHFSWDN